MSGLRFFSLTIVAIAVVCVLQACQTYRECRQHYKFERTFCAGVLLP